MTVAWVDSHCHLQLIDGYPSGLSESMTRMNQASVTHALCVAVELGCHSTLQSINEQYPNVFMSAGLHPLHQRGESFDSTVLDEQLSHPAVIATGETGLDFFHCDKHDTWQHERFANHIALAIQHQKPLIVHTREAREETIALLRSEKAAEVGGVIHCFTEDWPTAQKALDLGFYISFSGIITFKKAEALREVVKAVPLDRLLVETDTPYLAPTPHRSKPNEPSYVVHTANVMAELKGVSIEALADITTQNFKDCFKCAHLMQ